jgi:hypothetical protein
MDEKFGPGEFVAAEFDHGAPKNDEKALDNFLVST